MTKTILTVLLLLGIVHLAFCQKQGQEKIDSLFKELHNSETDTLTVDILIAIADETYLSNPSKTFTYCEKAKILSEKTGYKKGLSNAYGWLAYLYEEQGEIEKALDYYTKSLHIFEELGDKKNISTCLNNIAAIYKDQGKLTEALETHQKSLAIKIALLDVEGVTTSLNNIGFIYFNQGQIVKALEYYEKSLQFAEGLKNKEDIAIALHNIAGVYKDQKHFEEALDYDKRALKIRQEMDDKSGTASSLNSIGVIYLEEGKYSEALAFLNKALALRTSIKEKQGIAYSAKYLGTLNNKLNKYHEALSLFEKSLINFKEIDNKWGQAATLMEMANSYFMLNDFQKAEENATQSLKLAQELGYPIDIRNAAELLSKLYEKQETPTKAFQMYKLYTLMRDSIQNETNTKKAVQLQMQYEFDKREAATKIEQAKKDAMALEEIEIQKFMRNGFMVGFTVVLLFAGIFFTQRNKIKEGKKLSDELLLNILPEEVAEELKQKGKTEAKMFDEVTVMFTDFKNFTQISEKLSPSELVEEIDTCFKAFDNIITKYNIEKIKTIGDSYMCVGGLPSTNQSHAADVVNAAIEIQQFIKTHITERIEQGKEPFEIRIGIHTGPVIAGIVGVKKFAYDIWGDTVNIASRMESSGEVRKINISGTTYELVKDQFNCSYRGKIKAKNKGEIDMYFVEA